MPIPPSVIDQFGWVAGLANDLVLVADGLEPVTFQSTRLDGSLLDTYPSVLRRALNTKEQAASGGAYQAGDIVWLIPMIFLQPGIRPKPADVVIDSAQDKYTVLEAAENKKRQTWRLVSRNLSIYFGLNDWVDIQAPDISYDRAGVEIQTFPEDGGGRLVYANLRCKVQPIIETIEDARLVRGFKGSFAVYVNEQLNFSSIWNKYRIKYTKSGVLHYLDVVDFRNADQIGELPVLGAELRA